MKSSKKIIKIAAMFICLSFLVLGVNYSSKVNADESVGSTATKGFTIDNNKKGNNHTGYINPVKKDSTAIINNNYKNNKRLYKGIDNLPTSYNIDKSALNLKETIYDQGAFGTCWAFSSLSSAESSLYKMYRQKFPLSAYQLSSVALGSKMMNVETLDFGGNADMAGAALTNWYGATDDARFPYIPNNASDLLASSDIYTNHQYILKNMYVLPSNTDSNRNVSMTNINIIKSALVNYGDLMVPYFADNGASHNQSSAYFNAMTNATYCNVYSEATTANHGVTIVGYD
ncbi:MAG: hypothetical protein LBM02_08670, partial [Lachnospiraceae bacterium]|nr:hypothetical protein [Lachnospiraceae bacterium]